MGEGLQTTRIRIARGDPMPVYAQLVDHLRTQIAEGNLRPGDPVPSIRSLVEESGLSSNTVLRALTQLAREGLVTTRRGSRTCVAQPRPRSTEILLCPNNGPLLAHQVDFFDKLVAGVRAGYDEPNRRFLITHAMHDLPTGEELVQICRLRNADGLVAYRPTVEIYRALKSAAHGVAVTSIFRTIPEALADCVVPKMDALRGLLQRRIEEGKRAFAFAGTEELIHQGDASVEPYALLYRIFTETMTAAGLEPVVEVHPAAAWTPEKDGEVSERIRNAAVVVTTNPYAAGILAPEDGQAEWISYTEYQHTVELLRESVTFLYLGIEVVGRAAAGALASRAESSRVIPARRIEVEPEVIGPPEKQH